VLLLALWALALGLALSRLRRSVRG
jgi:hypothetical protein